GPVDQQPRFPAGAGHRPGFRGDVHPAQHRHRSLVLGRGSARPVVPMTRTSLRNFRTFARNKGAMIGIFILLVFAVAAIFAPLLTPYDPTAQDLSSAFLAPSAAHWFGTDDLGQD